MNFIDWFMPLLRDLLANLAPVAFLIWGVSFALDFIVRIAKGESRRL